MTRALYTITSGLSGCYMPDNVSSPQSYATRRELMNAVRAELEMADFPKSAIRQVKATRLWSQIKARGSSCAHFSMQHDSREVAFHGLTQAEFDEAESGGMIRLRDLAALLALAPFILGALRLLGS